MVNVNISAPGSPVVSFLEVVGDDANPVEAEAERNPEQIQLW